MENSSMLKKILTGILFATTIATSSAALAAKSGSVYVVENLYSNFKSSRIQNNVIQLKTGQNYSCGPTSLLILNDHFSMESIGQAPEFTSNTSSAKSALSRLYSYLGQSNNTETSLADLRSIAKYRWSWDNVIRMSASHSVDTNMDKLRKSLREDKPALIVLNASYEKNPVNNIMGIDHIVIAYAYQHLRDDNGYSPFDTRNNRQNDRIYFLDPYKGETGYFTRAEASTAVNLAGFAYLQTAP